MEVFAERKILLSEAGESYDLEYYHIRFPGWIIYL